MQATFDRIRQSQPQLFSAAALRIPAEDARAMAGLIAAIEAVIALPAYRALALARAPDIARRQYEARGVFMGYDFHLTADGPQLIEINTNAGGGLLNAYLLAAHGRAAEGAAVRAAYVAMFREEWRRERGSAPLRRIAIVDQEPAGQFLAPEFTLFRELFEENGISAVVCDPVELRRADGALRHQGQPVDLVYNRLTDFCLAAPCNAVLREAVEQGEVVLTPHPGAHALYADKRNLSLLSDADALAGLGVPEERIRCLLAGVPRTVAVSAAAGEEFWNERKRWFFKPPGGFGSRAAYRGDKLTRRVFDDILQGGYLAQRIAPPSEHAVPVDGGETPMKADIRCYVYDGVLQLISARLYQGQTTNFRTPGGGFAPVFVE